MCDNDKHGLCDGMCNCIAHGMASSTVMLVMYQGCRVTACACSVKMSSSDPGQLDDRAQDSPTSSVLPREHCVQIYGSMPVLARLPLLNIHNLCEVILATVGHLDQAAYDSGLEEGLIHPFLQGMALHVQGLELCIIGWNVLIIFILHIQRGTALVFRPSPPNNMMLDAVVEQQAVSKKGRDRQENTERDDDVGRHASI